jgi:hypothetical protein
MKQEPKEGYLSEADLNIISSATTSKPMILLDKDKYDELIKYEANKHYVELGKAVEKAYKETYTLSADATYSRTRMYTIKDLLNWAESEDK